MADQGAKLTNVNDFFKKFVESPEEEKEILTEATMELKGKDLENLKARIEGKKKKDAKNTPASSTAEKGKSKADVKSRDTAAEMVLVEAFWGELEKMDPATLLSEEVMDAFKYVGFNPDIVLMEVLHRGRKASRSPADIKKDMVEIVTIAIIKGSITEKNLKKTSDAGKVLYKAIQERYQLSSGGAKGQDSTYLTVARVAAAVPGLVIQILIQKPEFAKIFVGPFSSKSLPPYLRHQASAACIPETCSEKLKEYLLGLITAFTADQTKVLSGTKESAEELFDKQLNYVQTTFGSSHPTEDTRKRIFTSFSLSNDFEKLHMVALKIKKIKSDFVTLTQAELDAELAK